MIRITLKALEWFSSQHDKEPNNRKFLVLGLKKSGCSGYAYEPYWTLKAPDDCVLIEEDKTRNFFIVISQDNLSKFDGLELDMEQQGINRVLIWKNPNIKASCGCGNSVSFTS